MAVSKLLMYVKGQKKAGVLDAEIKESLKLKGWYDNEIEEVFQKLVPAETAVVTASPTAAATAAIAMPGVTTPKVAVAETKTVAPNTAITAKTIAETTVSAPTALKPAAGVVSVTNVAGKTETVTPNTEAAVTIEDPQPVTAPPVEAPKKSPLLLLPGILLLILAVYFAWNTATLSFIQGNMEFLVFKDNLVNVFPQLFPKFLFVPVLYAAASYWFAVTAFMVLQGTKTGFYRAIISLLIIPVVLVFGSNFLLADFLTSTQAQGSLAIIPPFTLASPYLILIAILLALVLVNFKNFNQVEYVLGKRANLVSMAVLAIFLIVPAGISGWIFVHSQISDFGYNSVKGAIKYHVYRPEPMPSGYTVASRYIIPEKLVAGKRESITAAFDNPQSLLDNNIQSKMVILKEAGLDKGYSLDNYMKVTYENPTTTLTIPFVLSSNKNAFVTIQQSPLQTLTSLTYITQDGVLIDLTSPVLNAEQLVLFAKTLN